MTSVPLAPPPPICRLGDEGAQQQKHPEGPGPDRSLDTEDLHCEQSHQPDHGPAAQDQLEMKTTKGPMIDQRRRRTETDRTTQQVLVELKELVVNRNQELQWQETARWTKFEGAVEAESRPHLSPLSFHSLLELRRTITQGDVLLDLKERTLQGISEQVVRQLVRSQQIQDQDRDLVQNLILLRHSCLRDEKDDGWSSSQSEPSKAQSNHREPEEKKGVKLSERGPERAEATLVLVGSLDGLDRPCVAFVRLQESVLLEAVLDVPVPVRFLFLLLGPPTSSLNYHLIGRSISTLMSDTRFHQAMYQVDNQQDLLATIDRLLECSEQEEEAGLQISANQSPGGTPQKQEEEQKKVSAGPQKDGSPGPSKPREDHLKRSGRLFGGLVRDVTRRYPQYLSDITDALNPQCMAAVIFIYFAALSPAITFGGLLAEKTEGLMGVSELMVATAVQGTVFSLVGAQPLLVIGFSGPLLVFEEAFYSFCRVNGVDYLTGRVWIGFWLVLIVLLTVAFEGSVLVALVSRFTQEIFSFLISLIFIYETFAKLVQIFQEHPLQNCCRRNTTGTPFTWNISTAGDGNSGKITGEPNTALLSLVLMTGTFCSAFYLRMFRNSSFFPGRLRRIIGDFGVPISILIMVLVDYSVDDTFTQKLSVPSGFSVSSPEKRDWLISPLGSDGQFPVWMMAASVLPAVLVFILIFMESQITALIVSKKERKLVKGTGFHLDLLVIVLLGGVSALFGLPWLSAATVRSVTHTNALTIMSKTSDPGVKPQIQKVLEQRMTGFLVAVLVGLSIVMGGVLRQIPLAVLFGIFLYMGVMSLNGIQLTERLVLLLMPSKHHPNYSYTRQVRSLRMHLFTLVQLICLSLLWLVMATAAALAFPFVLLLTIPVRIFLLPRLFNHQELQSLDSDDAELHLQEGEGQDEHSEMQLAV